MMTEVNLNLACELKEMLMTRSIDIGSLKNAQSLRKKSLELACDEECLLAERNRSMAVALQLEPNAKHKAIYSDFLKQYAREEPAYVFDLEKRFEAIVSLRKLLNVLYYCFRASGELFLSFFFYFFVKRVFIKFRK